MTKKVKRSEIVGLKCTETELHAIDAIRETVGLESRSAVLRMALYSYAKAWHKEATR